MDVNTINRITYVIVLVIAVFLFIRGDTNKATFVMVFAVLLKLNYLLVP